VTDLAEVLERMRIDAERAGFESLAVAAYFQGRARLAMRDGDLRAAIDALEEGRARDRGYELRGRRADYHAVFLAGLCLEAGQYRPADQIIAELRSAPQRNPMTVAALDFHLACRGGELTRAERLLDEILTALAEQSWRSGEQAHDLLSAALAAGLPLSRIHQLSVALMDGPVGADWPELIAAQVAEVSGELREALAGYRRAAGSAVLLASVRGTAHAAIARCLLALNRPAEAMDAATVAADLLRGWGGWRVAQLEQVRIQLGMAATDDTPAVSGVGALTPREREVALLVADGLTNAELARRLYISPRTAAVHVSSILHKLNVASRADVSASLAAQRPRDQDELRVAHHRAYLDAGRL
jgi:DNA-binding CsgD family transcriptional regulator